MRTSRSGAKAPRGWTKTISIKMGQNSSPSVELPFQVPHLFHVEEEAQPPAASVSSKSILTLRVTLPLAVPKTGISGDEVTYCIRTRFLSIISKSANIQIAHQASLGSRRFSTATPGTHAGQQLRAHVDRQDSTLFWTPRSIWL